jgi:hypothetical protein
MSSRATRHARRARGVRRWLPNFGVVQLLTKDGIVRFVFSACLLLCGSALGYYLGRPAVPATLSDPAETDSFDYSKSRRIEAAEAWRIYFAALKESRTFVDDPKPHPFFAAVAFALAGTTVLGVGAMAKGRTGRKT